MLIRAALGLVLLAVIWLFTARSLSLLLDRVFTVPMARLHPSPVGWNGTYLQFGASRSNQIGPDGWTGKALLRGSHILGLEGPDYRPVATLSVDAMGHLVLDAGGRKFTLGDRAGVLPGGDGPIAAYAAEPGDEASLTIEHSWLSWPTPLEMNFVTGYVPSWRRHLYYRLTWIKPSGARLDMVWRYGQGFDRDNGWNPNGRPDDPTGLLRLTIRPAP